MTQADTVTRILDAAEELFADRGFSETSLRSITSKARVNLAAVNYHFGSKKDLIQAVFARFLDPFCRRLDKALDQLEQDRGQGNIKVEEVLALVAANMVTGPADPSTGKRLSVFMRLLGLAYTQSQGHMRRFLRENYYGTYKRVVRVMQASKPELSQNDVFWRLHFAIGSAVFSMSSIETLRAMAQNDTQQDNNVNDVLTKLVPFIAAGMGY